MTAAREALQRVRDCMRWRSEWAKRGMAYWAAHEDYLIFTWLQTAVEARDAARRERRHGER